jgi:formylglycine-generating enzyme required for sulfatase activity
MHVTLFPVLVLSLLLAMPASAQQTTTFRDCPDCPEMLVVPKGSARLASGRDVVVAAPFAMGKFEVTFAQWDACVAGGGCANRADDHGWGRGDKPVNGVNWMDAQEYVAWLSKVTGKPYRLPSEAEWEYAAQAGTGRQQEAQRGADEANCTGCGSQASRFLTPAPAPVGSFPANAFGLHDMLGNVREWVADCWNEPIPPAPRAEAVMTGNCSMRMLRGGSLGEYARRTNSSERFWSAPHLRPGDYGLRVVRAVQ